MAEGEVYEEGYEMTPLQKHVAFFDRNRDGLIYPHETFQGFRVLGFGVPMSVFSALFINGGLSLRTKPGKFPSLLFPIYIKNIHKGKHGSDSGVYDTEGRFVPENFEKIFKKHARANPNALNDEELKEMLSSNRNPMNYIGWIASYLEWKVLFHLCKDEDGFLQRETLRALYDGSLFPKIEKENASRKKEA